MSTETLQITATLATLIIVAVGVTFAALQVRQETLARRLQGMSALFAEVWPEEASQAAYTLRNVQPGFDDAEMSPELTQALLTLMSHYNRVGFLLQKGLVNEKEILGYPPFGIIAADMWALFEGFLGRLNAGAGFPTPFRHLAIYWEHLAVRAKAYWEREGRAWTANEPYYTAEPGTLMSELNAAAALRPTIQS